MHGLQHVSEGAVHELMHGLGIEAAGQRGGVRQVGEEHGHMLSFAFQGRLRDQDALGQVAGSVGARIRPGARAGVFVRAYDSG